MTTAFQQKKCWKNIWWRKGVFITYLLARNRSYEYVNFGFSKKNLGKLSYLPKRCYWLQIKMRQFITDTKALELFLLKFSFEFFQLVMSNLFWAVLLKTWNNDPILRRWLTKGNELLRTLFPVIIVIMLGSYLLL